VPTGTVAGELEQWGTATVPSLVDLLEATTRRLQATIETLALDEATYHREYWSHWQTLNPSMSVAAMTRECERQCAQRNERVIIQRSIAEALRVKRDSLVCAIGSRS
jgi:hypothetical protein